MIDEWQGQSGGMYIGDTTGKLRHAAARLIAHPLTTATLYYYLSLSLSLSLYISLYVCLSVARYSMAEAKQRHRLVRLSYTRLVGHIVHHIIYHIMSYDICSLVLSCTKTEQNKTGL